MMTEQDIARLQEQADLEGWETPTGADMEQQLQILAESHPHESFATHLARLCEILDMPRSVVVDRLHAHFKSKGAYG